MFIRPGFGSQARVQQEARFLSNLTGASLRRPFIIALASSSDTDEIQWNFSGSNPGDSFTTAVAVPRSAIGRAPDS